MEVRYCHPNLDAWLEALHTFVAGGPPQPFVDQIATLNSEEREITHERDLACPILSQVATTPIGTTAAMSNSTTKIWTSRRCVSG